MYDNNTYASATCAEFKPDMDNIFLKELALVFRVAPKPQCIHSIGRIPKKDLWKSHLITDCSRPYAYHSMITSNAN